MKKTTILLIFVSFYANSVCAGESYELKHLRSKIESRKEKLSDLEGDIADLKSSLAEMAEKGAAAVAIETSIAEMSEKDRKYRIEVEDKEQAAQSKAVLLGGYRKRYQVRGDFQQNEVLGDITTKDGRALKSVVFKEVKGATIRVAHSNGFAVVDFSNLPDSLAGRVNPPPSTKGITVDIAAILRGRPDALKTGDRVSNERQKAGQELYQEARDAQDDKFKKTRADKLKRAKEHAEAKKKRLAVDLKIRALKDDIKSLYRAVYQQEQAKNSISSEMRSRSVRPSASNMEKAIAPYDRKITSLRSAIKAKNLQVKQVTATLYK